MASVPDKFALPSAYAQSEPTMWIDYAQLAATFKCINIGLGFPDFAGPKYLTDALVDVMESDNVLLQQYTKAFGHGRLVNALSKLYSPLIEREIDPQNEILVTMGASHALFTTILSFVCKGDEVILIEPFFDIYEHIVLVARGTPRFIQLRNMSTNDSGLSTSDDWGLNTKELEELFNPKTKAIIVNTPHNPLGKVFTQQELEVIANLCKKWNVLCIADEVYEWLVYKPKKHFRIVTIPGMWERTITIGSAGKTFSVTGWRTGWAYGPSKLMHNLQMFNQNCIYSCTTPIQEAIARGFEYELQRLGQDDCYFVSLANELKKKRDYMVKFLSDAGMKPVIPDGGYFVIADFSTLLNHVDISTENDKYKDYRFTKWMIKNVGVQGIPTSTYYSKPHKPLVEDFVRYCFVKEDETLQKAAEILLKWKATF